MTDHVAQNRTFWDGDSDEYQAQPAGYISPDRMAWGVDPWWRGSTSTARMNWFTCVTPIPQPQPLCAPAKLIRAMDGLRTVCGRAADRLRGKHSRPPPRNVMEAAVLTGPGTPHFASFPSPCPTAGRRARRGVRHHGRAGRGRWARRRRRNTRRCPRSGPPGRCRTLSHTANSFCSRDPPWDARRRYWILITGFGSTRRRRWSVMGIRPARTLRLDGRCRR